MKKTVGAVLLLLVVAVLGYAGWQIYLRIQAEKKSEGGPGRGTPAVAVALAPVERQVIRDIGTFTGTMVPKSRFDVAAKVPGRLKRILVNISDPVRRDQMIAVLDDDEVTQQVEQSRAEVAMAQAGVEDARSAVEVARSTVDVARKEYERLSKLKEKGIASTADLDVAEAKLKASEANLKAGEAKQRVAEAQINQRDAAFKAAQIRLSYTQVRASWQENGDERVVGERFVDEGALLKVNDPIISVLEDRVLTAVVYVIERDYPKVKVGQDATVLAEAHPERTFPGRILRIAPLLRETSRQGRVEIEVANPDRLMRSGMFVRAQVEFARHDDAIVVPKTAIVRRDGGPGVFIADLAAKKARFQPLKLGIQSGDRAEVLEPKDLSGSVIILGQHLLSDGAAIVLPEEKPAGKDAGRKTPGDAESRPDAVRKPRKDNAP
jgi:RND family efflux transporter MFP subunit